jgi:hypothetical protein
VTATRRLTAVLVSIAQRLDAGRSFNGNTDREWWLATLLNHSIWRCRGSGRAHASNRTFKHCFFVLLEPFL